MNNKTPFESSKSDIEAKIFSASKNTIVQCPSCLTRYAVESSSLAQLDAPKFHCSRCDHLFGSEDAGHFYSASPQTTEPAGAPLQSLPEYDLKGRKISSTEIREVTVDLDTPSFRHDKKNRALQIPGAIVGEYKASAPHEIIKGGPAEILTAESGDQTHFNFEYKRQRGEQSENPRNFRGFSLRDASYGGQNLTPADFGKVHYDFAKSDSSPWTAAGITAAGETTAVFPPPQIARPPERMPLWRSIAIFGLPMLITLCLLAVFGAWLSATSNANNAVASMLSRYLYQTSPARLSIRDAGFKRVTLEDGTNINLVTGVLANNTGQTWNQVTVEGFAFDSKGRAIITQRTEAVDSLAKSRVKSLSPDMIRNLQNSKASKPLAIKPGEKLEFSLALLPDAGDINTEKLLSHARYFGTRVYSVKK